MKLTRARYQQGSLEREERKTGPDVWVFRWREETPKGRVKRKIVVGTVEQYKTRAAAQRAIETLRMTINSESWMPSTLEELVDHYRENELPSKTPYTQEVYEGYLKTRILPTWGTYALHGVRTVKVEEWLGTLSLSNGSKAKIRNIMQTLWSHAMRYEWIGSNPITKVRQSAKREKMPEFLTVEEINALLAELAEPYRTMIFVVAATGLRLSELLGLKWLDFDFEDGQINLCRGFVRTHVGEMKTEASRKPLPLDPVLSAVLMQWRAISPYNQPSDWVFASPTKRGTQPYWPNAAMEDHIRPAGKRAKITKRIGWHMFRHSVATLMKDNGADVKVVQELLRHSTSRVSLDVYTQAMTPAKREAQSRITRVLHAGTEKLAPYGPTTLTVSDVSV